MTDHERYERFLWDYERLVTIDSSSANPDGLAQAAEFLCAKLDAMGLATEISRQGDDAVPCLKACTPSRDGRYDCLFLGHMDTVFAPGEAARRPFRMENGRAYGPGVNDMKGGLLLAVNVLETLREEGALDELAICLAFNGDEETGSVNSRHWIETIAAQCDRVLVFEACHPGFRYVLRRKGSFRVDIRTHGVSAHAGGVPQKGVNAVVELAHQIGRIHALNQPGSGITAQCTQVSGGESFNIVPDTAHAAVDLRVSTRAEQDTIETFCNTLPDHTLLPGASVEVSLTEIRPPMEASPESQILWDHVRGEAEKLGLDPADIGSGGCSDGNWTAAMGIPTIDGMGPVGGNSHREDEYMELDSILPALRVAVETCKHFRQHRAPCYDGDKPCGRP